MQLKLSLAEHKTIWALSHPNDNGFIKNNQEVGMQKCVLILTKGEPPKTVELDNYPLWAQNMIKTSIYAGEIINTGDKLDKVTTVKREPAVVTTPTQPPKTKKKK